MKRARTMGDQDFLYKNNKCSVTAGASPSFGANSGFAAVTHTSTGLHRVTLTEHIPTGSMIVQVSRKSTGHGSAAFAIIDDGTIDVYTFGSDGSAADANFHLVVGRVGF